MLLDRVIETGEPLEIERAGGKVQIIASKPARRLDRLKKRRIIRGDPEEIVSIGRTAYFACCHVIAAQAMLAKEKLLTKDSKILLHCPNAVWK